MPKRKPFSSLGKDMSLLSKRYAALSLAQVRRVSVGVGSEVINATPFDSGRARGNWLPSLGSPVSYMNWSNRSQFGANAAIRNLKAVSHSYQGGSLFVANNLPYINRLNNGWSAQQSVPGWIERTAASTFDRLNKAWWHK